MTRRSVRFLTRGKCHLCDGGLRRLVRLAPLFRVSVEVVEITSDRELEDEYHLRIPVILGRDGDVLAEGELGLLSVIRALVSA